MSEQELRGEAVRFFDGFVQAFHTFSGENIAALYLVPNIALQADGSVGCLRSRVDVERYFQAIVDEYHGAGCRSCRYRDLDVIAVGSRSALATVTWELLREDGGLLKSWRESYNVFRSEGGMRAFASTDHVE